MVVRQQGQPMIVNFATVAGASVAALLAVHAVTFVIARRIGRYNVVDVAWGLGFIAVALVAAILGNGDARRRWLLLALVAIWGLRLSWYIYRRSSGKGEDPRYANLLRGATVGQLVRGVFLVHGWWSLATVLSPSLMTYFLVYATGGRLTETYMKGRPGFSEYQQRTSFFIPRPPRSARR
jgi:steroid 5-alpha reductase family enzyme